MGRVSAPFMRFKSRCGLIAMAAVFGLFANCGSGRMAIVHEFYALFAISSASAGDRGESDRGGRDKGGRSQNDSGDRGGDGGQRGGNDNSGDRGGDGGQRGGRDDSGASSVRAAAP